MQNNQVISDSERSKILKGYVHLFDKIATGVDTFYVNNGGWYKVSKQSIIESFKLFANEENCFIHPSNYQENEPDVATEVTISFKVKMKGNVPFSKIKGDEYYWFISIGHKEILCLRGSSILEFCTAEGSFVFVTKEEALSALSSIKDLHSKKKNNCSYE